MEKFNNESAFNEAIDTLGETFAKIESLKAEAAIRKAEIELYANEHKITKHLTERFRLTMKKWPVALRRLTNVNDSDVVALLGKSEVGQSYLTTAYDSEALKRDFGSSASGQERLAEFGLYLTDPKRHATIKPL